MHEHAVLADEPAADAALAPHGRHLFALLLKVVMALYLPAAHCVHSVAALASENVPAPQSRQSAITVAPAVARCLPAAQAVHVELPFVSEYVPLAHGMHAARP